MRFDSGLQYVATECFTSSSQGRYKEVASLECLLLPCFSHAVLQKGTPFRNRGDRSRRRTPDMVQQRSRQGFHRLGCRDARGIPRGPECPAGAVFLLWVFVCNVLVACVDARRSCLFILCLSLSRFCDSWVVYVCVCACGGMFVVRFLLKHNPHSWCISDCT